MHQQQQPNYYPLLQPGHAALYTGAAPPAAAGFPGYSLSQIRAEVSQAAQRRDAPHLRSIVHELLDTLSPAQLDECLVLHYVAWTGELNALAEILVQHGCNVYAPDLNGDSVAHYCVKGCNLRYLKYLHGQYGTRLFSVLNNNHFNLLLTAAAETSDDKAYEILGILEWMFLQGVSIESQDMQGRTPLMWACRRGSNVVVQWLMSRGASLSARDHLGRTCLHMACLSGDDDTVLTVCDKGGINFYTVEAADDSKARTPLQICWQRGFYFLGLTLRKNILQKKLFNSVRIFRSMYAWYYWILMAINVVAFLPMAVRLVHIDFGTLPFCAAWCGLYGATAFFWLVAFFAEPAYVKPNVVPDQSWRCSPSFKSDIDKRPVFHYHPMTHQYKLHQLEVEIITAGYELVRLNKAWSSKALTSGFPLEVEKMYDACANKIQRVREQILRIMDKVASERRSESPKGYARMFDQHPRRVCITCRIIKPFRAHHCSDCEHCINRFDHHCVWLDNCIGKGNQRSFFLFLLSLTSAIFFNWYCVGLFFLSVTRQPDNGIASIFREPVGYAAVLNSFLNVLWVGFVGYLLLRTVKSMSTNITFYEYLKKPSHIMRRFNGRTTGCCWDLAGLDPCRVMRNIWSYFVLDARWDSEDYPGEAFDHLASSTIPLTGDAGVSSVPAPAGSRRGRSRTKDEKIQMATVNTGKVGTNPVSGGSVPVRYTQQQQQQQIR
eukprot:Lankesteria_metandrocarpae@DN151_c0_g1_i1.p1